MLNVAVVGYGYWGPNLARNFNASPNTRLAWVVDADEARLAKVKAIYPAVKTTTDLADVLNDPAVDALSIATPVNTHYDLTMQALDAGKHVLVEKPMADSHEKCRAMMDRADEVGKMLMVDLTFPYTGAVRKMMELVQDGALGTLYYFDSVRVNLGLFQSDVDVAWDLAVHDLSILEMLVPYKPVSLTATGISHVPDRPINTAYLTLLYDEPFIAHIHVSWLAPVKLRTTLLGGSEKMVVYDDTEATEKVKVYDKGITVNPSPQDVYDMRVSYRAGDIWIPRLEGTEALTRLVDHFAACCAGEEQPLTSAEAGARIVGVLEAASRSMATGGAKVSLDGLV